MKCLYFLFFLNNEKNNPPINPPYKVLFVGFEVIAQLPELHPTNFQYKKPAINPTGIPITNNILDFIKFFIILFYLTSVNVVSFCFCFDFTFMVLQVFPQHSIFNIDSNPNIIPAITNNI